MKEETAIELLKLATSLACATISQNNSRTATGKTGVEVVLEDCLIAVRRHYHDLIDSQ